MIEIDLLARYTARFGQTFTPAHWDRRPGDRVNEMMRAALRGSGPVVSDDLIATDLADRSVRPTWAGR